MIRIFFVMITLILLAYVSPILAADVQLMTSEQLNERLNDASIVILDARGAWDWVKTDDKIAGAIRVEPGDVDDWAGDFDKAGTIVLYCA